MLALFTTRAPRVPAGTVEKAASLPRSTVTEVPGPMFFCVLTSGAAEPAL
jgi:hypothetical protein